MQPYFDSVAKLSGAPLRGASITVTSATTGALATIYSDNGVTTQANPMTSDVNGNYGFYAADDRYLLTFSGNTFTTFTKPILLEDQAASTGSASVGHIASGAGSVATTVQEVLRETVSVKRFGAVGDGVTDDTAALQAGITYAAANDKRLHIPAGRYYVPNSGTTLSFTSSLRMSGDGMYKSVLLFDDDVSGSRNDFLTSSAATDVDFSDFGIEGTWGDGGVYTQRSQLVQIEFSGNARVTRCRFSKARYMALILLGGDSATVTDCEFYRTVADGCRLIDVTHTLVANNKFKDVNDDAIAIHTLDSAAAPIDNTVCVSSNEIVDSQGITILGGKRLKINDNILTRIHTRAILVGPSTGTGTEGNTAPVSISITNNVITDVFDGSVFAPGLTGAGVIWIHMRNFAPTVGGGGYVGGIDGAGGVVDPWPYLYTNDIDNAGVNPGAWFINISGNICTRTLTTAATYSVYGYGSRYGRAGPANPAIVEANILGHQIQILEHARDCLIANNILHGGDNAIYLDGTAASAYNSWANVSIGGNNLSNFRGAGVYMVGPGVVKIQGNTIDGDPYNASAYRAANGKWGASYANVPAFWFDSTKGILSQNTVRNVGQVFRGSTINDHWWDNNTICCNPVAAGYSANNIGIGDIGNPERMGIIVVEDSDPASSTFGRILNACLRAATTIPTTGTYVRGHYVRHANPAVAGSASSQYVITGWVRISTGAGHVLNTDWAEMRCLTGT